MRHRIHGCRTPCRLIAALLRLEGASGQLQAASVAAWLLNPFTATISTRGSGEALVVVQLLLVLLLLRQGESYSRQKTCSDM